MSSTTTKYGIAYPQLADTIASLAATVQSLAGRVDLLLGESGLISYTGTAGVTTNTNITLARTYPGNVGAAVPGIVWVQLQGVLTTPAAFTWWTTSWLGTATTITGFTLGMQFTNAQTARPIAWRFLPVL